jgi:hypothetical protein
MRDICYDGAWMATSPALNGYLAGVGRGSGSSGTGYGDGSRSADSLERVRGGFFLFGTKESTSPEMPVERATVLPAWRAAALPA